MAEIIILGGGFAGLWAALVARRTALDHSRDITITLVSKDDQLTLRPRLYEPEPERFRVPLRPILEQVNINFIEATVIDIDTDLRRVTFANDTESLSYDRLVLATGSVLAPLPVPGAETAFDLDSWSAAMNFERYLKRSIVALEKPAIAIIGAGFTGLEIALNMRGRIEAVASAAKANAARILLLDRTEILGAELGDNPRPVIKAALADAGIEIRLGVSVTAIDTNGLTLAGGERIEADAVIVSTGMMANPLTKHFAGPRDDRGRLVVSSDLRVDGFDDVFAAGDVAYAAVDEAGHMAMMSCQHAMMMGRFAGHKLASDLIGLSTTPYRQERYVTCLDLGSAGTVFTKGWEREVEKTGIDAKKIKENINGEIIYPPRGDRDQILSAATLVPGHHRSPPESR
jgi:NADH dehydrogenase